MLNKVINCYYNKSSSGIGDFLRGCCHLFNILNEQNINFEMSFKNHDLSKYLRTKCSVDVNLDDIYDTEKDNKENCNENNYFDNMEANLLKVLNSDKEEMTIFSNYSNHIVNIENYFLPDDCKQFMKDNLIFSDEIDQEFANLDLKDYIVAHFRLGDRECCQHIAKSELSRYNLNTALFDIHYEKLAGKIVTAYLENKKTVVVMSDSNKFKEYIKKNIVDRTDYDIRIIHEKSQHTSDNPGFIEALNIDREIKQSNMYYVALDMKIISKTDQVQSYSVYPWGSGFSFWLARIFDIPISQNSV